MIDEAKKIVVAMALDNDYVMPTYIAVYSMLENCDKNRLVEINFLVPDDFSEMNIKKLEGLHDLLANVKCRFHNMGDAFKNVPKTTEHITYPTYYRLLLPNILPDERCIYLDGDILVLDDISGLMDIDLGDNMVGGVMSPGFHLSNTHQYLGIERTDIYVNAGVLVMNLAKMREASMVAKFLEMDLNMPCVDQDVINKACYRRIKLLPLKYNVQIVGVSLPENELKKVFSKEELEEARKTPVIIHFHKQITKPWKSERFIYCDLWWDYFDKTIYQEQREIIKKQIFREEKDRLLSPLLKKLGRKKKCVIFGYTSFGEYLLNRLQGKNLNLDFCFCDNDVLKQGLIYKGVKVEKPEVVFSDLDKVFFIVSSQKYAKEIKKQLLEMGISEEDIHIYIAVPAFVHSVLRDGQEN
jgi:lipopolysaccharide biosynthesis glycosyltransferase